MRKSTRKSTVGVGEESRNSVGSFSTRFSLPSFVKRVDKLTDEQKNVIKRKGFGNLLLLPNQMLIKNLLVELMDRWSCEDHAFVLPPGKIEITLMDVALILGLPVIGDPIILKGDEPCLDLETKFGAVSSKRKIDVAALESKLDSLGEIVDDEFVRTFLLFTIGTLLFPNASGKVDSRYLCFLENLDNACHFAWGAAVLEEIFMWLNKRKEMNVQYIGGCLIFLQIWSYEHIDIARPSLLDTESPLPRACRWEGSRSHQRQWFTARFKELQDDQVIWKLQPSDVELRLSVVKELLESQNNGEELPRKEFSSINAAILDVAGAESDLHMEIASKIDDVKEVGLEQMREPTSSYELGDYEKDAEPASITQDASMSPSDGDENDMTRYQMVEEENVELKMVIDKLRNENAMVRSENIMLRDQLSSSALLEEQIVNLKREVEDLKKENEILRSSSDNLAIRLERILLDWEVDTAEGA